MESGPTRERPTSDFQTTYRQIKITQENVESCYSSSVLQNDGGYKEACVKVICENLRVENCIRFLNFAKEVICDELLATVRDFILKNIDEVKGRQEFLDLLAGTIDTLLVPITALRRDDDKQQLKYSPSSLLLSLYEWMSEKRHQRVIKFDQILQTFPLELVDADVLEKVIADEDLQLYPKILMVFCGALLKKDRQNQRCSTQGEVRPGVEMETETRTDAAHNYLSPKVEAASTPPASDNDRAGAIKVEVSAFKAAERVVVSVAGSTGGLEIPYSAPKTVDHDVIIVKEIPRRNRSKDTLEVKMESEVTTGSLSMHSVLKMEGETVSSAVPANVRDISSRDTSLFDPALPVGAGSGGGSKMPSTPERDAVDLKIVDAYSLSDWLSEVMPRVHPYFPQTGDDLIYFRQGHKCYMEEVSRTGSYPLTSVDIESLPYQKDPDLPGEVPVKLTEIIFKNYPPRVAILKLERTDWESKQPTGDSFSVHYQYIRNVADFLVLRQVYDYALKRRWRNGERHRFRSLRGNAWRTGNITQANVPYQSSFPDSRYLSFLVAWDDHGICQKEEPLSPWELYPIENDEMCEILSGKSEKQDKKNKRISSLLDFILKRPTAKRFQAPHTPEFDAGLDYPMNLSIIKARLDNSFYRSNGAILTDSEQLAKNVEKCFPPEDAQRVSIFHRLIQEMVSNVHMTWNSLQKRYTQLCQEGISPDPGDRHASGVNQGAPKQGLRKRRANSSQGQHHACKLCDFQHPRKGTIKEHERKHTGEQSYACSHCRRPFKYRKRWENHENVCKESNKATTDA